jgi:hypothetical protein
VPVAPAAEPSKTTLRVFRRRWLWDAVCLHVDAGPSCELGEAVAAVALGLHEGAQGFMDLWVVPGL